MKRTDLLKKLLPGFIPLFFAWEIFQQKGKPKKPDFSSSEDEEWLPVVDEDGKILGKAARSACHNGQKILHPVIHLHVMNPGKHIFLQKRPETKLIQPGKWDTAVGGHIAFGEDVKSALKREAFEEIGLKNFTAKPLVIYIFESEIEREMVYSFLSYDYRGIHLHSEEVTEGKFWSKIQIEQNLGKGVFTPNFEMEYQYHLKEKIF